MATSAMDDMIVFMVYHDHFVSLKIKLQSACENTRKQLTSKWFRMVESNLFKQNWWRAVI